MFPGHKAEPCTSWHTFGAASRSVRGWLKLQKGAVLLPGYRVVLLYVQGMDVDHTVQNITGV